MTIIVTGGAGFIGSNFIFYMLKEHPQDRIVCLDSLTYAGNLSTLAPVMDQPNFRFVKLDICDRPGVYTLFEEEKPDVIVNFAAESHVDRSIENPEVFLQTNIIGTSVLMDACRKYGISRYHQVSTDEVYGDLPLDRPDLFFHEDTPIHTSSPYSTSKASADLLVMAYHRTYGLPVTISRCSNNYGPYQFPEKLIPLMIANALAGEAHGLLALRRLDDAGDDIDLAALQAESALLPGARHEDDLAPCIAAERLHEVRLHAVEIAGRILCDVRADMVYPHAQERPRLHT